MSATTHRARYRDALPQLRETPFLTDGGIETTLIFHEGHELPYFAAYDLMTRECSGLEATRLSERGNQVIAITLCQLVWRCGAYFRDLPFAFLMHQLQAQ